MITVLSGLADGVVGFEAIGEVTARDYLEVLDPAVRSAIAEHGDISVLYVLGPAFTGYSGGAMWQDAVEGTDHFAHWKRIGVVTDTPWVAHTVHAFSWMMPARIQIFAVEDRVMAEAWVAAD